jgi:enoyl-CoA hydratase
VTYQDLILERLAPGVQRICLHRPGHGNALDRRLMAELPAALESVVAAGDAVCILTGAGEEFCVGGDVADMSGLGTPEQCAELTRAGLAVPESIEQSDVIVIAAVNGKAIGGGVDLVLAADIAVASDRARFRLPEVSVGLLPAYALLRAPETIGRRAVGFLALSATAVDAAAAREMQLVHAVVPHETLPDHTQRLAERIAGFSVEVLREIKRLNRRDLHRMSSCDLAHRAGQLLSGPAFQAAMQARTGQ